jgi:hypothetical protein
MIMVEQSHTTAIDREKHHRNLSFIVVPLRGIFRERDDSRHKMAELDFPYAHCIERWKIGIIIERGVS